MDRIASQIDLLRYLAVAVPNQRKQLLRSLSREQINVISEISLNLLRGNVEIADRELSLLSKHKNTLRKLSIKSVDNSTKRELMCKDATGIKTLIVIFLKHFDNYNSYSDTSASDDDDDDDSYTPPEPGPTRAPVTSGISNKHGLGEWERLSETHFDSRFAVPTTDSETAAAAAAASSRAASTTDETTTTTTTSTNIE